MKLEVRSDDVRSPSIDLIISAAESGKEKEELLKTIDELTEAMKELEPDSMDYTRVVNKVKMMKNPL